MVRRCTAISLALISCVINAEELTPNPDKAYLVVGIVVSSEKIRQPIWLALNRARDEDHLRLDEHVFELEPGRYVFEHIDFNENLRLSHHTMQFERDFEFTLTAGRVKVFGNFEVSNIKYEDYYSTRTKSRKPDIRHLEISPLLEKACLRAPDLFKLLPVFGPDGDKIDQPCREQNTLGNADFKVFTDENDA